MKGGATTISTPLASLTRLRSSLANTTPSWTVLNIFQFPAMKGMRIQASRTEDLRYLSLSAADDLFRIAGVVGVRLGRGD